MHTVYIYVHCTHTQRQNKHRYCLRYWYIGIYHIFICEALAADALRTEVGPAPGPANAAEARVGAVGASVSGLGGPAVRGLCSGGFHQQLSWWDALPTACRPRRWGYVKR